MSIDNHRDSKQSVADTATDVTIGAIGIGGVMITGGTSLSLLGASGIAGGLLNIGTHAAMLGTGYDTSAQNLSKDFSIGLAGGVASVLGSGKAVGLLGAAESASGRVVLSVADDAASSVMTNGAEKTIARNFAPSALTKAILSTVKEQSEAQALNISSGVAGGGANSLVRDLYDGKNLAQITQDAAASMLAAGSGAIVMGSAMHFAGQAFGKLGAQSRTAAEAISGEQLPSSQTVAKIAIEQPLPAKPPPSSQNAPVRHSSDKPGDSPLDTRALQNEPVVEHNYLRAARESDASASDEIDESRGSDWSISRPPSIELDSKLLADVERRYPELGRATAEKLQEKISAIQSTWKDDIPNLKKEASASAVDANLAYEEMQKISAMRAKGATAEDVTTAMNQKHTELNRMYTKVIDAREHHLDLLGDIEKIRTERANQLIPEIKRIFADANVPLRDVAFTESQAIGSYSNGIINASRTLLDEPNPTMLASTMHHEAVHARQDADNVRAAMDRTIKRDSSIVNNPDDYYNSAQLEYEGKVGHPVSEEWFRTVVQSPLGAEPITAEAVRHADRIASSGYYSDEERRTRQRLRGSKISSSYCKLGQQVGPKYWYPRRWHGHHPDTDRSFERSTRWVFTSSEAIRLEG